MAEGYAQVKKNVLCRYFVNGVCRSGDSCPFSHERSSAQLSSVCKFYLQGKCSYGEQCRYDHIRKGKLEAARNQVEHAEGSSSSAREVKAPAITHSTTTPTLNLTKLSNLKPPKSDLNAEAAVFVPKSAYTPLVCEEFSYAQAVGDAVAGQTATATELPVEPVDGLCPFFSWSGTCQFGDECAYIHGEFCDVCQSLCLHPTDEAQRKQHQKECSKRFEEDMEEAFADALSKDKQCGICMDVVWERNSEAQQRFGILANCSHCFCVDCIRKWRQSEVVENKISRSCPECRVVSDYIIPSKVWVEGKEQKEKLIVEYRDALSAKHCKHFNRGKGDCPFGNRCFYKHELPDGTKKDLGPPKRKKRFNESGDHEFVSIGNLTLGEFLEQHGRRYEELQETIVRLMNSVEILEIMENYTTGFDD